MTTYLVDTNVLSELIRPSPDQRVTTFLAQERDLWISVVTLHELAYGAERIVELGATSPAFRLDRIGKVPISEQDPRRRRADRRAGRSGACGRRSFRANCRSVGRLHRSDGSVAIHDPGHEECEGFRRLRPDRLQSLDSLNEAPDVSVALGTRSAASNSFFRAVEAGCGAGRPTRRERHRRTELGETHEIIESRCGRRGRGVAVAAD